MTGTHGPIITVVPTSFHSVLLHLNKENLLFFFALKSHLLNHQDDIKVPLSLQYHEIDDVFPALVMTLYTEIIPGTMLQ